MTLLQKVSEIFNLKLLSQRSVFFMKVAFVSRQCERSNSLFAKSNLGPRPLPVTVESEMLSFCSSSNSVFAGGV